MPTVVRKSISAVTETRRQIFHAVSWQVHANIWTPPTDVYETDEGFVIRVELAGMREEDFEVAIEGNILMISGNRPALNERCAYHQMEIRSGKFEIAVDVPGPIAVEMVTAEYQDGFLTINLPKLSARRIEVE